MANGPTTTGSSLLPLPPQLKPPTYRISRASDNTLIFNPPAKSKELSEALSYHYPFIQGLTLKMQQATLDFLISELTPNPVTPNSPSDPSSHGSQDLQRTIQARYNPKPSGTGQPKSWGTTPTGKARGVGKRRGRTGGLEPLERERVAKNRGNACEEHRKRRTKCDQGTCFANKLNSCDYHRDNETMCHQSFCCDNKLNFCEYHCENKTKCTSMCPGNLLGAMGTFVDENNIAQESPFQAASLPAYDAHLGWTVQAACQQRQQFMGPQRVHDPFVSDSRFPPPLALEATPLFGSEPPEDRHNNQFIDLPSRPYADQYGRLTTDGWSGAGVFSGRGPTWYHRGRTEDYLSQPHPFDDGPPGITSGQTGQAAPDWYCDRGHIQQGVGVTSSAAENYEHRSGSSILPDDNRGGVLVDDGLLQGYDNQTDINWHRYYTSSSFSTTTSTLQTPCPWCHREWKYWELYSRIVFWAVYAIIKFWAWQMACCLRLIRPVYIYLGAVSSTRITIK